jgi:NitT/TauT family transport system substrate-binding protein
MRIAWAGSTPSNTPIWAADQKGFFKRNGLNAEVINISASTIVIQALLTGEVDFIIAPSATLVTSKLAGADTVMVSTNLPLFIDHIVSLGNITTIEQLKGKIGGVNRLGTTSDMTLRLTLRRLGIDPEKETKIIATGRTHSASPLSPTTSRNLLCSPNRWLEKPRSSAFATSSISVR